MKNLYSDEAFTGLEAAIVLIAFVVVAAVFSYVVLGAGFFTSQTAQATVHTGVSQASSSMELVGNVYGVQGATNLRYVNVTIALTAGGTPMDVSSMVVSYTDNNGGHNANVLPSNADDLLDCGTITTADHTQADIEWCIGQKINNVTAGTMLDNNAQMVLVVGMPSDTASPNTKFSINLQPSVGAVLPIARTIPGGLTAVQPLY
ncbi:MAG: archaellin/type IV pilin N-terminal domain-containing protein [Methanoregula sp.]